MGASASPAADSELWGDVDCAQSVYGCKTEEAVLPENGNDYCRSEMREKMLSAVSSSWSVPNGLGAASAEKTDDAMNLKEKLRRIPVEKISFRRMPFRDAVDLLAEMAEEVDGDGINFAIIDEPPDGGIVHLTLRNVTLGRAIELLAQCVDFDWEIDGDAVILSSAEKNFERLRTKFFPLSRAMVLRMTNLRQNGDGRHQDDGGRIGREEELLVSFFQNAGVDFASVPGSSMAFDGSGIVLTQTPRNLRRAEEILSRYGEEKQVEIEIKFIEVQQGALDELQFRWTISADGSKTALLSGNDTVDNLRPLAQAFSHQPGSTGAGSIVLDPSIAGGEEKRIPIGNDPPQITCGANLGKNAVPLVDIMGSMGGNHLGLLLRALEQQTGSDLMSAPKVTVLSGKTAEIVVAQEFRYPEEYDAILSSVGTGTASLSGSSAGVTITAGTPRNFKTRNIGVEMSVTPIVEADDRISLSLEPSVTEFEGFVEYGGPSIAVSGGSTVTVPSGFFQPIFSTRRIRTEVTIANGETVVMGGLTREEVKEVRDRIPFLGSIPLLGKVFRSKGISSQKRNLLIFVTARLSDSRRKAIDAANGEIVRLRRQDVESANRSAELRHWTTPELLRLGTKRSATLSEKNRGKSPHRRSASL
ncbi:MAG: type II and III secretion system protein [Puniceicoccales bacterium]|jgi:general secretion pathway protein D|nr:type II and III secretion system protein [Puniceicoccales bacterium]